jgi:hypothetical protein
MIILEFLLSITIEEELLNTKNKINGTAKINPIIRINIS